MSWAERSRSPQSSRARMRRAEFTEPVPPSKFPGIRKVTRRMPPRSTSCAASSSRRRPYSSVYSKLAPSGAVSTTMTRPLSAAGANSAGRLRKLTAPNSSSASTKPTMTPGRRINCRSVRSYHAESAAKKRSMAPAMRPWRTSPSAGRREASIGVSVSATSAENSTAAASVSPNSRNRRPFSPGRKEIGTNTATSVRVVATTAKPISRLPRIAATIGGSCISARRWMFSSTTIESSTTSPMASTTPSRVSTLME